MKYSSIKDLPIKLSQIALGTWVFSGSTWGGTHETDCIAAVHAAIDSGINVIDTAPIYGFGTAESFVGKAVKGKRDKVFLATKCGLVGQGKQIKNNLKPESIRAEIEHSLKRLQTDYVDLYQCHWPDPNTVFSDTWACLKDLQKQGKIRYAGVSNFSLPLLKDAPMSDPRCVTLQSPLSLLERGLRDDILPFCSDNGVGVLAYGPLGGGVLSGKYKAPKQFAKDDARSFFYKYYTGDRFNKVRSFLDKISMLDRPLHQVAINWVRQQKGVCCVLTGCRNAQQVIENVAALTWDLSEKDMTFINKAIEECQV